MGNMHFSFLNFQEETNENREKRTKLVSYIIYTLKSPKNWYRRACANKGGMRPISVTRGGRQRLHKTIVVC